jgi:hypothetical protein
MTQNDKLVRAAEEEYRRQTEHSHEIERQLEIAQKIMDEDRDFLAELAKR